MAIVAISDTALLALALVFIVALLRSHADILRRLAVLEDGGAGAPAPGGRGPEGVPLVAAGGRGPEGVPLVAAGDISGLTLAGDSVKLSLGAGSPPTLLAFLSSGCAACGPLWDGIRDAPQLPALAARVVIVTHDPARESTTRLRALAPTGVELILAGGAWQDYAVPASPHFVLTDGAGGIAGRGSALSWTQLVSMVQDARHDARDWQDAQDSQDARGVRDAHEVQDAQDAAAPAARARSTRERAARAEAALARSGIAPGHPSLYPDRRDA